MKYNLNNDFDLGKFKAYVERLIEAKAKVEIKKFTPKRTLNQNKYLHCIMALFASETGHTVEEMKTICKRELNLYYTKCGDKFLKSTALLSKEEMTEFISGVVQFAGKQGVYLPNPGEFMNSQFEIEKHIETLNRITE